MTNRIPVRYPLLLAFTLALSAAPALAQERGRNDGREDSRAGEQRRPELQRRGRDLAQDRDDDDRNEGEDRRKGKTAGGKRSQRDGSYGNGSYGNGSYGTGRRAGVPAGWCQGAGNPHNTVENCGTSGNRTRGTARNGGVYGNGSQSGSYASAHTAFHRDLDQHYRELAAQRPLDVQRQLQLRAQKSAEHDRWHAQMGVSH